MNRACPGDANRSVCGWSTTNGNLTSSARPVPGREALGSGAWSPGPCRDGQNAGYSSRDRSRLSALKRRSASWRNSAQQPQYEQNREYREHKQKQAKYQNILRSRDDIFRSDDVHLASAGLCLDDGLQETHKFRARVPSRGVAHYFARSGVERGIKRERPVSVVLEAVTFGASWRQRQDRVEPIERLNRRLFVDTEHHGMLRRIEVQADHIRRLRLELGIGRPHVPFEPMRLQPGMAPRSGDNRVLHAKLPSERPRRPMRCTVRRRATVHAMMRASSAGVSTVGFEPRWRAVNPAVPSVMKRCFHNAIVRELHPVRSATVA